MLYELRGLKAISNKMVKNYPFMNDHLIHPYNY